MDIYFKGKQVRTGIGGIEKKLQEKSKLVDKNISVAFEDLGKLMEKVAYILWDSLSWPLLNIWAECKFKF